MVQNKNRWITLVLVCIMTSHIAEASTVTLKQLLRSAKEHNMLSKSLQKEALALEAKSMADTASAPFELFGEGTQARPELGDKGYEYAIGISKDIRLGNIQAQERQIANLNNQANLIEGQKRILDFSNGLKNIYHQHCVDMQIHRSIKQSYADLLKLYRKKQKAYKYQEISKTELMQIESEKNRLQAQVQELKMMQEISKQKVLMLSRVGNATKLSCKDTYPIRTKVKLNNLFSLSNEAYQKRIESTKAKLKRYSHSVESLSVSGQYGKELDTDRYTVGVSLPLSFTSERSEKERAAALYKGSAIEYSYEQEMLERKSLLLELQMTLKSQALMVKTLSKNHRDYKQRLLPLVKKSYLLGETSVLEYLLSRQKLYTLNQELYGAKKAYYNTLFRLYTISEKKDKR